MIYTLFPTTSVLLNFNYFKLKNTNSDLIYLDNQPKIIINLEEKLKNDNFYYFILKKFNFKNKVIFWRVTFWL